MPCLLADPPLIFRFDDQLLETSPRRRAADPDTADAKLLLQLTQGEVGSYGDTPSGQSSGPQYTLLPPYRLGWLLQHEVTIGSAPLQGHAHVARHAAGKVEDLDPQLVAALTEILRPQLMDFLRNAGQRGLPARLLLVDGAPVIGAQLVRKAADLHLGPTIADRPFDDLDRAPNPLLVGHAGRLREVIEQCLLFRFRLRVLTRLLGCFLGFGEREPLHEVLRGRQQFVGFGRHGVLRLLNCRTVRFTIIWR